MRCAFFRGSSIVLAAVGLGCAGPSWKDVRTEDSPAAYRRFLERSPDSGHALEAQERLDFLVVKREPTAAAVDEFRRAHPASPHLAELEILLESRAFESARREGTVASYAAFLDRFPEGKRSGRARANLHFLQSAGFSQRPEDLAEFVRLHPEGDHTAEAQRSLGALATRSSSALDSLSIEIEVDPRLADADRVRSAFEERAERVLVSGGIRIVPAGVAANGRLTISHTEKQVPTEIYEGRIEGPGILAETRLSLLGRGREQPIWSKSFVLRVPELEHRSRGSILFSSRGASYWHRFFVPVSTWATNAARRPAIPLRSGAVEVAMEGDRAVVVFSDGSYEEIDLSNPADPKTLSTYARRSDLSRFSGARIVEGLVILYGEDGIELVSRRSTPERILAFSRAEVGAVAGLETVNGLLWIAGTRGLLRTPIAEQALEVIATRPLRGLAFDGSFLYVLDDRKVYSAPLSDARADRFEPVLDLGQGFEPSLLRAGAGAAVVLGRKGLLAVSLQGSRRAELRARLSPGEIGAVWDTVILGSRAFAIGERGLQIFDLEHGRVVDSIDVEPRKAIGSGWRHVLVADDTALQAVDATPWMTREAPASLPGAAAR